MYRKELTRAYKEGKRFFLVKRRVDYLELKELKKFPLFNLGETRVDLLPYRKTSVFSPTNHLHRAPLAISQKEQPM
jgi:cell division protein FtsI (penicillin-binding protein 3)